MEPMIGSTLALVLPLLSVAACHQDSKAAEIDRTIRQLGSEDPEERDRATEVLIRIGGEAAARLRAAVKDRDPEIANRAAYILEVLRIQSSLTSRLLKEHPDLPKKLALGDRQWAEAFFLVLSKSRGMPGGRPQIRDDLNVLSIRALRGVRTEKDQLRLLGAIKEFRLFASSPETRIAAASPSARVRAAAVEALGVIGSAADGDLLLARVQDEEPTVRVRALEAIAALRVVTILEPLLRALKDSRPEIRESAVLAVSSVLGKEGLPHIVPMLKDEDSDVRAAVLDQIGRLHGTSYASNIIPLLTDGSPMVRAKSAKVAAMLLGEEAAPNVAPLLKDDSAQVRRAALAALASARSVQSADEFVRLLGDEDRGVRSAAIKALAAVASIESLPEKYDAPILEYFKSDPFNADLAQVFALLPRERIGRKVSKFLHDEASDLRAGAAWLLGLVGAETLSKSIAKLLQDPSSMVRRFAVHSLIRLRAKRYASAVAKLLTDPEMHNRLVAIKAIVAFGFSEAHPDLIKALNDETPSVRAGTALALGRLCVTTATPALQGKLEDEDGRVRVAAASALCRLGVREFREQALAIISQSGSKDPVIYNSLNAIDCPTLWNRLRNRKMGQIEQGLTIAALIAHIGRLVEIKVDMAESIQDRLGLGATPDVLEPTRSLELVLEDLLKHSDLSMVLENATIRIVTLAEAVKHWKSVASSMVQDE